MKVRPKLTRKKPDMSKWQRGPKLIKTSCMRVETGIATGERFEARVKGLADTGNGIVDHPSGRVFFVPGVWPGELVIVQVKEVKKSFGTATLVQLLEVSSVRRKAICAHHGFAADACGGCPWMMVTEAAQLQAKQERVNHALMRIDENIAVSPIMGSPKALGYRVRAQLKTDGHRLGFVANGQRQLADVEDCIVLTDSNRTTLAELRQGLPKSQWRPPGKHQWTTLDIDESVDAATASVNQRLPFQQANSEQNQVMRSWLLHKLMTLPDRRKALELFAGSGNFTEVLAQAGFESIVAAEVVPAAVKALNDRQLPGVVAQTCDLFAEDDFAQLVEQHQDAEVLVLDPPRDGLKLKEGLLRKRSKLRHIFYISCDLATFSRDIKDLYARGFVLLEVQPVDMFPQTPHVEILAHLQRKTP